MKQVKVLISGCTCSQRFASLVEKVVSDNNIDGTVEVVDDIVEVMKYNVMTLPALVVDGSVVAKGQLKEPELLNILK